MITTAKKSSNGPWVSKPTAHRVLDVVHYAYPILLLVFFIAAFTARTILAAKAATASEQKPTKVQFGPGGKPLPVRSHSYKQTPLLDFSRSRKLVFQWLSVFLCLTFAGNATIVCVQALFKRHEGWWCGQAMTVYIVGAFFVNSLLLISQLDSVPSPTGAQLATWIFSVLLELAIFILYTVVNAKKPRVDKWLAAETGVNLVRILILSALIGLFIAFTYTGPKGSKTNKENSASSDESAPLLNSNNQPNEATTTAEELHGRANGHANGHANGTAQNYGTTPDASKPKAAELETEPGWVRPAKTPSRSWWEYLKSYSVLFPYLWPSKDRRLQMMVLVCVLVVALQRWINVLVPIQVGKITDELSTEEGGFHQIPWASILMYIVYRLLQGNNGLLGAVRSALWIPVSQYSYREISVASFEHVHNLSLDFHLGKKTGEVLSAMNKGNSINTFLEQVTFNVVPMIIDLGVAIGYFLIAFDVYYALVITVITFWYIYLTIRMAAWRADIRRDMVNADREQDAVKNDSMVSYETVKYFNAEDYEFNRYKGSVKRYQDAEYKVLYSLQLMNVTQNLVFMLGLMVACFIAAYQVTTGVIRVGKFVSLLTYMAQLQQPLNYFGTFYRMIQSAMINSERMLELFKEKPTVVDKPDVEGLPTCEGDILFQDVHFTYDQRKEALQGLSFRCPPGTTTAFVGESGGGKSTVFRLMFRFYQAASGSIQIDGHDVEDVSIDSVRKHIGVVPQDTVLFNETLMYNLKYANQDATNEQVYDACRAASIHDKIMTFPDQYQTKVGDRGLRLSGGEKQRVAIARTILKGPRIIMLDEATAALDSETEGHIQDAFDTLGEGRTMLVIAHRLSTITRADQILVLHEGVVAERGTHEELLALGGRYRNMWRKQIKAERVDQQAKTLQDKAERLRRESKDGDYDPGEGSSESSPSVSDGEGERQEIARRSNREARSGSFHH